MTRPEVLFLTALLCLSWAGVSCETNLTKHSCYGAMLSMWYSSSSFGYNVGSPCRITSSGDPAHNIVNCSGVHHEFIGIAIDRTCPVSSVKLSQGERSSRRPVSPWRWRRRGSWPWFHLRCSQHDTGPRISELFQPFQPYDDDDHTSSIYSLTLYDDNDDVVACATSELYAGTLMRASRQTTERPRRR